MSVRRQLPLFFSPELERAVCALPPKLRAIAEGLHRRVIDDDRTWLEVTWAAAAAERASLEDVLEGDRCRRPTAARHRAWYVIRKGTADLASYPTIGQAFGGVHHTTVMDAVAKYSAHLAKQAELEAVAQHKAGGSAA